VALIVTIAGSPSRPSRSAALAAHVGARLAADGFTVEGLDVRDLPAEDLLHGRPDGPGLRAALGLVERAQGVVVCSPVYKAAYSGLLKTFLDLLPQLGLTGKVVLPLLTGGTLAHVLALDYGLRPVLASLAPAHVTSGLFLLDKLLERTETGLLIDGDLSRRLDGAIEEFTRSLRRNHRSSHPG
jgi:FMN reductase